MYKKIYTFACIFLLCQCQAYIAPPKDLLKPEALQKVLVEIHSLEALLLEKNYNSIDSAQVAFQEAEKKIFKKNKLSYQTYKNSYAYYLKAKPEKLDQIYKIVIDTLEKREKKIPNTNTPADSTLLKKQERKRDNFRKRPFQST
jgi:hypothetical protein